MGSPCWGMPQQGLNAPAQSEFPDLRVQYPIAKHGVGKAKPVYAAQIALYQAYLGLTEAPAFFTAINKDTCEIWHELVPFDAALAQSASDKAVTILRACDAGELLPRHTADPDHFECRLCAWRERCWA